MICVKSSIVILLTLLCSGSILKVVAQPPVQPHISFSEVVLDESGYTIFHAYEMRLVNDSLLYILQPDSLLLGYSLTTGEVISENRFYVNPDTLFNRYLKDTLPGYKLARSKHPVFTTTTYSGLTPLRSGDFLIRTQLLTRAPGIMRYFSFWLQMDPQFDSIKKVIPAFVVQDDTTFQGLGANLFVHLESDTIITPPPDMRGNELVGIYATDKMDGIYYDYPELIQKVGCFKYPKDLAVNLNRTFFTYATQFTAQGLLVSYGNMLYNIRTCRKLYEFPPDELTSITGFYADLVDSMLYLLVLTREKGEQGSTYQMNVVDLRSGKTLRRQNLEKEGRDRMEVKMEDRNVLMLEKDDEHVYLRTLNF